MESYRVNLSTSICCLFGNVSFFVPWLPMCHQSLLEVQSLSARKLRTLLVQQLKVAKTIVDKIIDRRELKDLAEKTLYMQSQVKCATAYRSSSIHVTIFVGILTVIYFFRWEIFGFFYIIAGSFVNMDKMEKTMLLYRKNMKKYRSVIGGMAALVAIFFDLIIRYIQISALLSWIIPPHSIFYRYLWCGFSLPVDVAAVMSQYTKARNSSSHNPFVNTTSTNNAGWAVNTGPMITSAILSFLSHRLEQFSLHRLMVVKGILPDNISSRRRHHQEDEIDEVDGEILEERKERLAVERAERERKKQEAEEKLQRKLRLLYPSAKPAATISDETEMNQGFQTQQTEENEPPSSIQSNMAEETEETDNTEIRNLSKKERDEEGWASD
jgi:hypothetical protein